MTITQVGRSGTYTVRLLHSCLFRFRLLDIMYIIIGFIIFCLYSWLCFETLDFTGIVQCHPCLYRLSCFVFIHVHTIQISGTNWGIRGVTKRAVTMPPPATIILSLNCPFPFVWYSVKRGCINPSSLQGCYAPEWFLRSADFLPALCTVSQKYPLKRVL